MSKCEHIKQRASNNDTGRFLLSLIPGYIHIIQFPLKQFELLLVMDNTKKTAQK